MPTPLNTGTVLWVFRDHDGGPITLRTRMGDELRFSLGATLTGHQTHGPLKAGDRLVVAAVSAPNGNTLVAAPCGCSLLLLVVPAA